VPQRAQPLSDVASLRGGTHRRLPATSRRKVGMTSNHHAPYALGYTRATMAGTAGSEGATRSESLKSGPSSDRRLQLACVKADPRAIAGPPTAGHTCPGLLHTAPPPTKVGKTRCRWPNRRAGAVVGRPDDWGEVVTR